MGTGVVGPLLDSDDTGARTYPQGGNDVGIEAEDRAYQEGFEDGYAEAQLLIDALEDELDQARVIAASQEKTIEMLRAKNR